MHPATKLLRVFHESTHLVAFSSIATHAHPRTLHHACVTAIVGCNSVTAFAHSFSVRTSIMRIPIALKPPLSSVCCCRRLRYCQNHVWPSYFQSHISPATSQGPETAAQTTPQASTAHTVGPKSPRRRSRRMQSARTTDVRGQLPKDNKALFVTVAQKSSKKSSSEPQNRVLGKPKLRTKRKSPSAVNAGRKRRKRNRIKPNNAGKAMLKPRPEQQPAKRARATPSIQSARVEHMSKGMYVPVFVVCAWGFTLIGRVCLARSCTSFLGLMSAVSTSF